MPQYDLPYPLPEKYDPSGPLRNPGSTIPRPSPADMPVGGWIGGRVQMVDWEPNPAPNTLWRVKWASPIFDLRPDLGALSENRANVRPSGMAVWRAAGQNIAAQLFVQISGITDFRGFQVVSQEEAHVADVTQLLPIIAPQDVTDNFTSRGDSSVVTYSPFGDGYPIRYWRLRLIFNILTDQGFPLPPASPPTFVLQSALY